MPDYKINILVEGHDRASGPLRSVTGALMGMGQVAGGILGARLFMGIANGLQSIVMRGVMATATMQEMQVGMEGLIAKELYLNSVTDDGTRLYDNLGEALPVATERAGELMDELARIAVLSPYQVNVIQSTFRTAMAFGYSTDQATAYTKALLNVAAGTGANNEMMGRMAYNLAQIRMVGRVTAIDLRQLSMAGFDLVGVLRYIGDELGLQIDTHEDFNRMLETGQVNWDQFTELFAKYADENFGGAAERMSRTLTGLRSTFADVFTLTMPQILNGAVEKFTGFANEILDKFLEIRESPLMERMAEGVTRGFSNLLRKFEPFKKLFFELLDLLVAGESMGTVFSTMLTRLFGAQVSQNVMNTWASLMRFAHALGVAFNVLKAFFSANYRGNLAAWLVKGEIGMGLVQNLIKVREALDKVSSWIQEKMPFTIELKDVLMGLGIVIAAWVIPALLSMVAAFAPFFLLIAAIAVARSAWQNNWFGIRDTLTRVWNGTILPKLQELWAWLQVNVPLAIKALAAYWTNTLQPALMAFWGWVQTVVFPLLGRLWAWLQINIPLAIQWLAGFWTNTLQPALLIFWTWVQTTVFPLIQQLWAWLQVNIPLAIQWLSDLWTNTLWPAMQNLWNWITGTAIPALTNMWNWLSTEIPAAIETLSAYWTDTLQPAIDTFVQYYNDIVAPNLQLLWDWLSNLLTVALENLSTYWSEVLLPAITAVWEFVQNSLIPLWEAIDELFSVVLNLAITVLAGLWQNILLPALTAVYEFIRDLLQPVFDTLVTWFNDSFGPALEDGKVFLDNLKTALDGIAGAIEIVIGWIIDLKDYLANLEIPDWLTPGSPTPLELGLRGISRAMNELNRSQLPQFQSNLAFSGVAGAAGAGGSNVSVSVSVGQVNSPADVDQLAYKVAREIQRHTRTVIR